MLIYRTKAEVNAKILTLQGSGKTIGFVPTMGALHEGHLSLIESSKKENNITVTSIFVNPIQFNNPNDLDKYPRDEKQDLSLLEKAGCDIVFLPSVDEMYPKEANEKYNLGGIDEVMEGRFRPGHFQGVAIVVKRFFDIIPANNAYFGKKDFQQLAVIKHMVKDQNLGIKIWGCETIRDNDGLAKSSRNLLLEKEIREIVKVIPQTLFQIKELKLTQTVEEVKSYVASQIGKHKKLELEYFELVDDTNLQPINRWDIKNNITACIAVWAGKVRLIDNIQL